MIESKASNSPWTIKKSLHGLLVFSADGNQATVLEYGTDGVVSSYTAPRVLEPEYVG